jgi:hypothetical protein
MSCDLCAEHQYKASLIRWECYRGTGTIRALDQDQGESLHNPIVIIPLPFRVTAMGNEGDHHDDDTNQSSFQIWDDVRPMQ